MTISDKPFSFGTLAQAQAADNLESLRAHHRHAVRVQLGPDQAATVNRITASFKTAAPRRRYTTTKKRRTLARR